jgi:hypothetical protein
VQDVRRPDLQNDRVADLVGDVGGLFGRCRNTALRHDKTVGFEDFLGLHFADFQLLSRMCRSMISFGPCGG